MLNGEKFTYHHIKDVEKDFESTTYGINGKIDSVASYVSATKQDLATALEYKSGNTMSATHAAQVSSLISYPFMLIYWVKITPQFLHSIYYFMSKKKSSTHYLSDLQNSGIY